MLAGHCFDQCNFVVSFEIRNLSLVAVFSFPSIVLDYVVPVVVPN